MSLAARVSRELYAYMTYRESSTTTRTTAAEAFERREGVCQDYAHIFISAMRYAGVRAAYVSGLIPGEGKSHAWAEIWDGACWRGFDPTNNREIDDSYIRFCGGRDFSDCPLESGVFQGFAAQTQIIKAEVKERDQ